MEPVPEAASGGEAETIAVCIRVRPLNEREKRHGDARVLRAVSQLKLISLTDAEGAPLPGKQNVFQYDHIFDERASTRAMYEAVARRIVRSALDGINGTIFAYGQTSSGKTYTMTGNGGLPFQDDHAPGILQLAVEDIFAYIEQSTDRDFLLRVSFVEIYNEVVKDLLNPSEKGLNLKLREDPRKGVYVESREEIITNYEDILRLLHDGNARRTVGTTAMNDKSSRSHSIFRIVIESKQKSPSRRQSEDDVDGAVLVASLSLVDLAGSESMRHTAAEGVRQREAGNINKSLLTLSRVINSLATAGPATQNAPFRDSKLTRLLQNSLDGNTRTLIICCVTPADRYIEETKSTLQFAARAKTIQTSASVNEVLDDQAQLRRLKREVHELKKLVHGDEAYNALKAENELLQHEQNKNKAEIARLLGLMLSSSSAGVRGLASARSTRRHKRMRETWHPGDFSANMVAKTLRTERSPNPQPRKRAFGEAKENIDPQNLMAALDDAGDNDGDDDHDERARRRVSDPISDTGSRDGELQQLKQLVEMLENAVAEHRESSRIEEEDEDLEARVTRLVGDCRALVAAARTNEQLAGDHEVLKMAAEELQMRLQLSQDQENQELENTKELLEHVKREMAGVQDENQSLQLEKEAWATDRRAMEDEMATLRAQLEALSGLDGAADGEHERERTLRELARQNEHLTNLMAKMKQETEEMQRSYEEKAAELEVNAKRDIEELSSQLQEAFVELEEHKLEKEEEITKLEEELLAKSDELEQKLAEFASRESQLQDEIASLKATLATSGDVEEAQASLLKQVDELKEENDRVVSERSQLMDAMVELEEQLQKVQSNTESQFAAEKNELSARLAEVERERDAALAKLEQLRSDQEDNAVERIRALEQELAQAQSELAEASNDQEAEANRADEAVRALESARADMEKLLEAHKREIEAITADAAQRLNAMQQERESMVANLHAVLAEKDVQLKQSEAAEAEARSYRDFLQGEMDDMSQKVANLENAKAHFANENSHLRQQLTDLNNEMLQVPDTLASEIEELTEKIESLRAELDIKTANEKILTTEIKKSLMRTADLEAQLADKTGETNRLQESLQALDEEKAVWLQKSASSEELQGEIVRMREERWGLATKWEETEAALTKERRETQRLSAELRELEAERETLDKEKETLAKSLEEKESKVRQLASELDATQTEKAALEDLVSELEGKFEVLEIAKKSLDESLAVRVAEVATKTTENAELRAQIETAESELQSLRTQLEEHQLQSSSSTAAEVGVLHEQIQSLEKQCEELSTSQESLREEVAVAKQSKSDLVEELSALESQLMALSEEKLDLQAKLDSAVAALDDSSAKTVEEIEKVQVLTRDLEVARNDLSQVIAAKTELMDSQRRLSATVEDLKAKLAEKEQQLAAQAAMPATNYADELAAVTLRLETESQLRERAELDAKSYEEALEMMRDDFKHKLEALKSSQIAAQETLASKKSLEADMAKLKLELTRAKEEQDELRYQNQQRLLSTQGAESLLKETVEMLEQELAASKDTLAKTEAEWKSRAQQAEQQFRRLESELHLATSKESALKEKLKSTEQQLATAKDTLVETENEWKNRAQQAEQHFRRLEAELQVANEERARLAELAEQSSASGKEIEELQSRIDSLVATKQHLQDKLEEREHFWSEQVDEVSRKGSFETSSLREQLQEAQDEVEAVKKFAEDQITQLRGSIEQNESELHELRRVSKQREVALSSQVEELETELSELRSTSREMRAKLNERDESNNEIVAELSGKVEQLTQQLSDVDEERGALAEQLNQLKAAMEKLEGEDYQHRNELEDLAESLKSAQLEAMHYHNQLAEVQQAKEKLDAVVETQRLRIDKLEKVKMTTETLEVFRKLKSDRQSLQLQVQKLEKQLKDVAASKALTKEAAEQQQSRLLRLKEEEVTMFKSHIEELKTHIDELKRAVQNEKDRNADMRQELQSVVDDIRDKAQQEVEDMRDVLKEKSEQVVELEAEVASLKKHKETLTEHKSSKESFLEKENLELLVEVRQLKKRLESRGISASAASTYRSAATMDDDVAAFEASAKAASALLAEPSAVSAFGDMTPAKSEATDKPEPAQTKPASTKKSGSGLSSFLMSSSSAAAEEEEEARPACSQQ